MKLIGLLILAVPVLMILNWVRLRVLLGDLGPGVNLVLPWLLILIIGLVIWLRTYAFRTG